VRSLLIFLACLCVAAPLCADVRISYLFGSVLVNHNNVWSPADITTPLNEKDKVRTAANSRAVLMINDLTHIWVGQNTQMEISSAGNGGFFSILAGKIRAKVKLLSGQKFQVRTPVAVASIRGTELVITSENELTVLEGRVDFSDVNGARHVDIGEGQVGTFGQTGLPAAPRNLTPQERERLAEEWKGFGDTTGGRQQGKAPDGDLRRQADDLRREMREIVSQIQGNLQETREITNEIKESDMSAGRTLRDVYGNLVRVEQHLLRPDNQTLEFLNLTKRSDYRYSDRRGWGFTVPSGSRLDVMDVTLKMNMPLPEQITEWPAYISSQGDKMHPQEIRANMTNQEDTMEFRGSWTLKGQPDEKGKTLNGDRLVFNSYINGYKVDPKYDAGDAGRNGDGHGAGELWAWGISPRMRLTKDGKPDEYVRLYTEVYAINNDGSILNLNNFTSTNENPFTFLKKIAGEQVTFCRKVDNTSFFARGNLDLIVTPDLAVAIAEKLATQVGEISKSESSSNN